MKHWVYFLIRKGVVIYIGCSMRPDKRIHEHKLGGRKFDSTRRIECKDYETGLYYEKRWIKKFKPKFNIMHNKIKSNTTRIKPVEPSKKMVLVGFYVQQCVIDLLGGKDKTREIAKEHVEHRADVEETGRFAMHG